MKLLWSLIFVIIAFIFVAEAQDTTLDEALSIIQSMPQCGVCQCLEPYSMT